MRISFERTGGFANVPLRAEIDTTQMPANRAQELEWLVEKARPFDQPAQPQSMPVPDDLHYELKLEDASRSHSFRISDSAARKPMNLNTQYPGFWAKALLMSISCCGMAAQRFVGFQPVLETGSAPIT